MAKAKDSPATEAPKSTALARVNIDPQALIQAAVEKGAGIETLERLVALAKDVQAERAREAWYGAMAEFQRDCPPIRKTETASIQTRTGGSYRYTYAPLDEIMRVIGPVMGPLGLSVSYRVRHEKDQVIAACRVSHEMGHHEESGEVAMPVLTGDMGANPAQRIGIASSYAKRYALLAIIGLAPEDDADAAPKDPVVKMPRPASQAATPAHSAPAQEPNTWEWRGSIASVISKSGTTNRKPWTLYTITGQDGTEFGTFDEGDASFCRSAGRSAVTIIWEVTPKGSKKIISVQPDETEPEGDDAQA